MAGIEGFRVRKFRALHDVSLGKLFGQKNIDSLTPFTVVIGKNGVGKNSLFDAFGFIADCLATDVETACDIKQRGGFERLLSKSANGPIQFEIYYREALKDSVCDTWELLADAVYPGGSKAIMKSGKYLSGRIKHEWSERIGPELDPERNKSPSFRKFVTGLNRLMTEYASNERPSP